MKDTWPIPVAPLRDTLYENIGVKNIYRFQQEYRVIISNSLILWFPYYKYDR